MVRAFIDTINNGIGGASEFVMEPASYESTLHRGIAEAPRIFDADYYDAVGVSFSSLAREIT
jgi:hypothetical protein